MSEVDTVDRSWRPAANPWLIALVVTSASFMEVLDSTIVNVALPHIAGSMSASADESTWVLTSYLVANGIVLPISGFFTRILGRKRYFLISIAMFTVCSLLCGLATNLPQIIIFRLLQGFFGGGLQPNQQSIILDTFPPNQRSRAFALTAMATVVAPVLGPTLGGVITDNFSWRWVFLINVPVGVLAFIAVMVLVEDPPWLRRQLKASVDYVGLGFIILGFGALQIMLDRGEDADWFKSGFIQMLAVMAAAGIGGGIFWLLHTKNPIVDLRALADRNFAVGCLMISAMAFMLYSSGVLIPQLAQQHLGYTATWSGLILMPGAVALVFLIIVVGRILPLFQTRYFIGVGFFILGCSYVYSHGLTQDIDFPTLVKMRIVQTMGLGFLFVPISTIAYLTLAPRFNSDAASLYTMFRNIAGSVGISVATALVSSRSQVRMAYLGEHMTPLSQPYNDTLTTIAGALGSGAAATQSAMGKLYQDLIEQSQILAYTDVFAFCAALAFCTIPLIFLFSPAKASGRGRGAAE